EPDRPQLAPERRGERKPSLPEREVQRRALEPPPAVVPLGGPRIAARKEIERTDELGERVERVRPCELVNGARRLKRLVERAVVSDVLPYSLLAPAAKPNDGCPARERARDVPLEAVERVALDDERKLTDE